MRSGQRARRSRDTRAGTGSPPSRSRCGAARGSRRRRTATCSRLPPPSVGAGMALSLRSFAPRPHPPEPWPDRAGGAPDLDRPGPAPSHRPGVVERTGLVLPGGGPREYAGWGALPPRTLEPDERVVLRAVDAHPAPDVARRRRIPGYLTIGDL